MTQDLIPNDPPRPDALGDVARGYATNSKSESTRRNYRAGFAEFASWCQANGRESLPATPGTVADYLSALAERGAKAVNTICLCADGTLQLVSVGPKGGIKRLWNFGAL